MRRNSRYALSADGSKDAAQAIMTTDTRIKEIAVEFSVDGTTCHVAGISKGSGMIHPNMATMLGFLTTDVKIKKSLLKQALSDVVKDTFNMVSVDGDTSTNDMVSIMASGLAENEKIKEQDSKGYQAFYQALMEVCTYLARIMAKDGEGATKLIECKVHGAQSEEQAKIVAKSIVMSNLTKAAVFGARVLTGVVSCAQLDMHRRMWMCKRWMLLFAVKQEKFLSVKMGQGLHLMKNWQKRFCWKMKLSLTSTSIAERIKKPLMAVI